MCAALVFSPKHLTMERARIKGALLHAAHSGGGQVNSPHGKVRAFLRQAHQTGNTILCWHILGRWPVVARGWRGQQAVGHGGGKRAAALHHDAHLARELEGRHGLRWCGGGGAAGVSAKFFRLCMHNMCACM